MNLRGAVWTALMAYCLCFWGTVILAGIELFKLLSK